jgi:nitrogen fixation/metabolism regulation signal transduction histidine kinase
MIVSAADLSIAEVNKCCCEMLGRTRENLIGENLSNIKCALQDLFF